MRRYGKKGEKMSLDIDLEDEHGNEVASMNWLRNPFGLERWAEGNVGDKFKLYNSKTDERVNLWYVCNRWNYDKGNEINFGRDKDFNRILFKEVVDTYWEYLSKLKCGYFFFSVPLYQQFLGNKGFPLLFDNDGWIVGSWMKNDDIADIAVPMRYFEDNNIVDLGSIACKDILQGYKDWFLELVNFAVKLQDPDLRFYCSN